MDPRRDNYIRVINAFNKIEAKAYLFSNSNFQRLGIPKLLEIFFLGRILHVYYKENVRVYLGFTKRRSFLLILATAILTATRRKSNYFLNQFEEDYLDQKKLASYG